MKKIGLILITGLFCVGLWSQSGVTRTLSFTQSKSFFRIACLKLRPLKQRVLKLEKDLKRLYMQKQLLKTRAAKSKAIVGFSRFKSAKFFNRKMLTLRRNVLRSQLLHLSKLNANARSFNKALEALIKEFKRVQRALNRYRRLKIKPSCFDPLLASLKRSAHLLAKLQKTKVGFSPAGKGAINLAKPLGSAGAGQEGTPVNSTELGDAIKKLETDMETMRNKRREYQNMFENFDQKANQLFNILNTVMKSINEMRAAAVRNIL